MQYSSGHEKSMDAIISLSLVTRMLIIKHRDVIFTMSLSNNLKSSKPKKAEELAGAQIMSLYI